MAVGECENLDAYIGGWLDQSARSAFEAHLRKCPACQGEISRQERIDRLMKEARRHLEPVPPLLMRRIEGRLQVGSAFARPRHWVPACLSAAAILAFALVLPLARRGALQSPGLVEIPDTSATSDTARPLLAVIDRQRALQQLAVLVTSQGRDVTPDAHPRLRLAAIAAPREHGMTHGHREMRRSVPEPRGSGGQDKKELKITRGPPPFSARAVQRRWTLGQRKLYELGGELPDVHVLPYRNGS